MTYLLKGTGLGKRFGGVAALQDIEFHINRGEILGLIGPNGAGKTTLFNIIAGFHKADKGQILFNGENIASVSSNKLCRKGIARTFQIPKPFLNLSVFENVIVGAYFGSGKSISMKAARERGEEIIERVGLKEKTAVLASNLTLVERKLLEMARALASDPVLLMLDEVIAGLNPTETLDMVDIIFALRSSGITIFMIEHVIKAVMKLSDRIVVLHFGKKIAEGVPREIINNPHVIKAYLGGMTCA